MHVSQSQPTVTFATSEGQKFVGATSLTVVHCFSCGMPYAIPTRLYDSALRHRGDTPGGWKLICPLGHVWWYSGETELQRAQRLREEAQERERRANERREATRELLRHEERSHAATKGHLTRTRKRVKHAMCPVEGCRRHFTNLERHLDDVHPDFKHSRGGST